MLHPDLSQTIQLRTRRSSGAGHRLHRSTDPLRARLPAVVVPVAPGQPARRPVRRLAGEPRAPFVRGRAGGA